jgi:hypothetical protein
MPFSNAATEEIISPKYAEIGKKKTANSWRRILLSACATEHFSKRISHHVRRIKTYFLINKRKKRTNTLQLPPAWFFPKDSYAIAL